MEQPRRGEAIAESLLKLGTIVPISHVNRAVATQKILAAQGKLCSLTDALKGELTERQLQKIDDLQNFIQGYTIWENIGEGKFGIVYKARQHSLDRWVAIKILKPEFSRSQPDIGRFLREIHAMGKLDHPNILHALDSGQSENLYYLVTEYFDGVTLAQYIRLHGKMPERRVLEMGVKVASALEHIWERQMIHRDIVPENIMISQNDVKLCDMGLIRAITGNSLPTPYQIPRRSYSYIPPEQLQGKMDFRSDIYSLGAVLYFALTGHHTVENWEIDLDKIAEKPFVDPAHYVPDIHPETKKLVMQMLSISPQNRRQDRNLAQVFEKLLADQAEKKVPGIFERFAWVAVILLVGYGISSGLLARDGRWAEKSSAQQVFTRCAPGVVVIRCEDLLGSGVIVSYRDRNWVITNAHLIQGRVEVRVALKDGREFTGKIAQITDSMDLALIAMPADMQDTVAIPMSEIEEVSVGDDVFVIGHPKGYFWSLTRGTVSGIRDDTIQTDAAINVGNSGGPVLDSRGRMLGLTTYTIGKNNPIGFAIAVTRIMKFLESTGL